MRRFVSERGKLVSGQRIGVTAKNQRRLARALKRAQHLALIPMAPHHTYVTGSVQTQTPRQPETESADTESTASATPDQQPQPAAAETAPAAVAESENAAPDTPEEASNPTQESSAQN
jgi:hypothetical protein